MSKRLFFGGIETESNSFSPLPIGFGAFETHMLRPGGPQDAALRAEPIPARALALGLDVAYGLYTSAPPGGPVRRDVYEALRDELLADLKKNMPVDIVAYSLHGGMIAQGYDDCEGDLLARTRAIVGPNVTIGAVLDPHSHFSSAMYDNADVLLCYRENPHVDIAERSAELVDLLVRVAAGEVKPKSSIFDCRMADVFQTNREPMQSFVKRMRALEQGSVLSISIVHGFRRGDLPFMGTKVLVITDNDEARGKELAETLGRELFAMRGTAAMPTTDLVDAVAQVKAHPKAPILLADMADNPDCGAPGDSTYVLRALMDAGVTRIAFGAMVDPLAVQFACEAGVGAQLTMRIGGKACSLSGDPIDLEVVVKAINTDAKQSTSLGPIPMGTTAALQAGDVDIVVTNCKRQTFGPDIFTDLGVDLSAKKAIVVKSAQHYRVMFKEIFVEDIVVDAPGVCPSDVSKLPFKRITRPLWPFDENPFG